MKAYEEIIDFIAAGATPGDVVAFKPSHATKERVRELMDERNQRVFLRKRVQNSIITWNWNT